MDMSDLQNWRKNESNAHVKNEYVLTPEIRDRFNYCGFVLRFYSPVNPVGSYRARSVYLTARVLGRLSPLSG